MGGRSGRRRTGGHARAELRRYALGLPGAHEDFPWGESVVKAGKKVKIMDKRKVLPYGPRVWKICIEILVND